MPIYHVCTADYCEYKIAIDRAILIKQAANQWWPWP